jgi:DNA-binding transcriptional ArsR family regulator
MTVQGTRLEILNTMGDIQEATSTEEIEAIQIAEEMNQGIRIVRSALDALAKAGYVKLEKVERLSGMAYSVFLTHQGELALKESRSLISESL